MRVLRFLVVMMSFVIEVRVKAVQQEPENCLTEKNQECTLLSLRSSYIKTTAFDIDMQKGSVLYRNNKSQWNLVSGTIRVANSKGVKLKTKVGSIQFSPGVYWVRWVTDRLWIASLGGQVSLSLISNQLKENILPEGFINWYGLINYKNVNEQGIPRAANLSFLREVIPVMAHHPDRTLVEKKWSRTIAQVTDLYRDVVQMMEDSDFRRKAEVERRALKRYQIEREAQELFRQKYLSPMDLSNSLDEDNN